MVDLRPGDRIKVVRAASWTVTNGMTGTVLFTDSLGTVHCQWDGGWWRNKHDPFGGQSGIDPAADRVELIEEGEDDGPSLDQALMSWPDLPGADPASPAGLPTALGTSPVRRSAGRLRHLAERGWRRIHGPR